MRSGQVRSGLLSGELAPFACFGGVSLNPRLVSCDKEIVRLWCQAHDICGARHMTREHLVMVRVGVTSCWARQASSIPRSYTASRTPKIGFGLVELDVEED